MANYGPPGGSPEPWGGRRPDDRWSPSAPEQPPLVPSQPSGHPPYRQPGEYGSVDPYAVVPPATYPGAPTPGRGRGLLVAVLVVLGVLVLGGGILWYLLDDDDGSPSTTGAVLPTAPVEPDGATSGPTATTPAPASSADPRFVKAGQCVRNEGPAGGKPKLLITACAPKTYEVLRRFDGATSGERDAEAKCGVVEGYTNWYFFDSELDTLDFVLCLKQR
ncbi:LppU/SCO3897 family protein [Micromonospora wenchangensis]|uniref:LppU/SCO3897 family protein n=1 Tax=Micromonospora wenchangensis TaxID=1185415 RepID=UPI003D73B45B